MSRYITERPPAGLGLAPLNLGSADRYGGKGQSRNNRIGEMERWQGQAQSQGLVLQQPRNLGGYWGSTPRPDFQSLQGTVPTGAEPRWSSSSSSWEQSGWTDNAAGWTWNSERR